MASPCATSSPTTPSTTRPATEAPKRTRPDFLYVAVTRAQKYLYATFAPIATNQQQRTRSAFFHHIAAQQWVSTVANPIVGDRLPAHPLQDTPQVTLSFSELKYLFECSYQFKLRFSTASCPIHEALGYGKGLHDALAEVHKRALDGDIVTRDSAAALIDRHLNAPFAYAASATSCARPPSTPLSGTSTATATRSPTPSSLRSRSRSTSPPASPSTAASTSSAASTPARSPSSIQVRRASAAGGHPPGTNSTCTPSGTKSSPAPRRT